MHHNADDNLPPSPRPWPRRALSALSLLGLLLSSYLSYHSLTHTSVIGCSANSPCDDVLSSHWSSIAGILPVSGLAAGAYLALLLATFFLGPATPPPDRRLASAAILLLSAAAAASALWFIAIQEFALHAFCPWCMATHLTGLLLFTLALAKAPTRLLPTLSGLLLAALLILSQLALTPKPPSAAGDAQTRLPTLDPHAVPLLGSPNASTIVTLLFDYNCPHCQHLHSLLADAVARYHGTLAFVLCPSPLNTDCNPYIPQQVAEFQTSCDLAKLSLAVYLANPAAFPAFDDWMFSPDAPTQPWHPRSLDAARAKALELVGQPQLTTALADPWIPRFLNASVQTYGNTLGPHQTGNAVPKLIFNNHWVTPSPTDTASLLAALQSTLHIPPPP